MQVFQPAARAVAHELRATGGGVPLSSPGPFPDLFRADDQPERAPDRPGEGLVHVPALGRHVRPADARIGEGILPDADQASQVCPAAGRARTPASGGGMPGTDGPSQVWARAAARRSPCRSSTPPLVRSTRWRPSATQAWTVPRGLREVRLTVLRDVGAAVRFLTVLPWPGARSCEPAAVARAAWAFPVVGLLVGACSTAAGLAAAWLFGPPLHVIAAVAASAVVTGGLHLDGLADSADALFSWRSREKKLEILRDSRTGTMGALALFLVLATKLGALHALGPYWWKAALLAAPGGTPMNGLPRPRDAYVRPMRCRRSTTSRASLVGRTPTRRKGGEPGRTAVNPRSTRPDPMDRDAPLAPPPDESRPLGLLRGGSR